MFDRLSVWGVLVLSLTHFAWHLISTSGECFFVLLARASGCYVLCLKMQKHPAGVITARAVVIQAKNVPTHVNVVDMKSLFWQRCATAFFVSVQNVKFDLLWKDVIWASRDVAIHCVLQERMCVFAFSFPEISRGYFATHCFISHQRR